MRERSTASAWSWSWADRRAKRLRTSGVGRRISEGSPARAFAVGPYLATTGLFRIRPSASMGVQPTGRGGKRLPAIEAELRCVAVCPAGKGRCLEPFPHALPSRPHGSPAPLRKMVGLPPGPLALPSRRLDTRFRGHVLVDAPVTILPCTSAVMTRPPPLSSGPAPQPQAKAVPPCPPCLGRKLHRTPNGASDGRGRRWGSSDEHTA